MSHDKDIPMKALNREAREVDAVYYKIAAEWGLSESAFWILYAMADPAHACTQQDICAELSISRTTVHSAIRSLAQKGYLFLERDPKSPRKKIVRLTECGEKFVRQHIASLQKAEQKAFLKMARSEREAYIALSQKYIAYLREEAEGFLKERKEAGP